jgi:xanthine dehydrogenase YagR molybdenum-binding subunit
VAGEAKRVLLPSGIAGVSLGEVERSVGPDEPPPLAANAKLAVIGKATPRLDGKLKVTGAATYTADVRLPGMLWARMVTSPHAHARVRSLDTSAASLIAGVRAVHVLERVRGSAVLRDPSQEEPSKYPILRYVGQPICAVAATTPAIADEAARLVKIDYEVLPFVVDLEDARKPGAPLVFPGAADMAGTAGGGGGPAGVPQTGNVHGPARSGTLGPPRGDLAAGLAAAEVVVDAVYRTQVQTHSAMETHGVVVRWSSNEITVYASTQGTASVRDEIAEVFGVPKSQVRVVTEFMGGGFGAKFGAGNFGVLAAHLSKKAGAPVRLMLDRREEHTSAGNRPSSVQRLRIGAKKDGTLTAIHLEAYGTAGTGTGSGCGGPAKNMYPCPNVLVEESDVFTHAGPAAAFRAPGHPQGCFALEQAIDELAEKIGMDPVALRDKIDVDEDAGGRNVDSAARKVERRLGAERIGWSKRHAPGADPGPVKRGIGMAQSIWYRFVDLDSSCEVRITRDGSVELLSAVQDIGTGIRTALAQVVAEELGLRAEDVTVRIGDTRYPQGPASGGSKTTGSITPAARNAAFLVKRKLLDQVAPQLGEKPENLVMAGGKVFARDKAASAITFKQAARSLRTEEIAERASRSDDYGGFIEGRGRNRAGIGGYGGVQFAAVAVDTETGIIKVERVVAAHDCGRPINPLGLESQINGGILQGISYALYENRVLDRHTGRMVNSNLEQYKIVGARETPQIEVILLEEYHGRSSTDAGGIGEPATIPTAAAVANAVYNAIGVRLRELPMTPARVLAALGKRGAR